jgi:ferric-dicitrate binding protein FerR (iron transport regulator)
MRTSAEMEDLLRAAKPGPRDEFVLDLERQLLRPPERRSSVAVAGAAAVGMVLALVVVALGVAGTLPLGLGGDRPATATDKCRTVVVERTKRVPEFIVGRDGELRLRYRQEVVRRPMMRCR